MHTRKRSSGPPDIGAGLVGGLVVSLVLGFGFFWSVALVEPAGTPEHPLAFAPIQLDQQRLKRERDRRYDQARNALEASPPEEFLDLVRRVNKQQFIDNVQKRRKTARRLSFMANDVVPKTGYGAFVAAGRPIFERCRQGLETLLKAVRTGELDLETARANPPAETYASYRANCGRLLPTLLERNLVDRQGYWEKPVELSQTIFGILQRLRWANIINTHRAPLLQLTDYERQLLMRWRIESPEAYDLAKRREFLTRIEQDPEPFPDYNIPLTRAKIAYQTGDKQRAAKILKAQLRKSGAGAEIYERALGWLESNIEISTGRKTSKHGNG